MALTNFFASTLDGNNLGFVISQTSAIASNKIGDINRDGYSDIALTVYNGLITYQAVMYGKGESFTNFYPSQLSINGGFLISSGSPISGVGDVNSDNYPDLAVRGSVSPYNKIYVIFGKKDSLANFDNTMLNALNGANGGFVISGPSYASQFGVAISGLGDINGDGRDDFIIGQDTSFNGKAYIVFGKSESFTNFDATILNGANGGFIISGSSASNEYFGQAVCGVDINRDGYNDLIIGAPNANKVYVVYGKSASFTNIDATTLRGTNGGFILSSGGGGNSFGKSISGVKDINGDMYNDLIIGSFGEVYVVFGKNPSFTNTVFYTTPLDGSNGFTISGRSGGGIGSSVSDAGDVNGDGFTDIVVGDDNNNQAYIIFGKKGRLTSGSNLDATSLNGNNGGFIITASPTPGSGFGGRVSGVGDINGDGYSEVIIVDHNTLKGYVVFGTTSFRANTFMISTTTSWTTDISTIIVLPSNKFIIAWQNQVGSSQYRVRARMFYHNGTSIRTADHLITSDAQSAEAQVITALPNGEFVVVWQAPNSTTNYDINAQIFDAEGNARSSIISIANTFQDERSPEVAAMSDGGFVIVWRCLDSTSHYYIKAQIFDLSGNIQSAVLNITTGLNNERSPRVATLDNDKWVVVWDEDSLFQSSDIKAQIFNSKHNETSIINVAATSNTEWNARVAKLNDGGFVIIWHTLISSTNYDIKAQIFNAIGTVQGSPIDIATSIVSEESARVATLRNGDFAVTWSETYSSTDYDIKARVFHPCGVAKGKVISIATTSQKEINPAIASIIGAADSFVVTWTNWNNNQIQGVVINNTTLSTSSVSPAATYFNAPDLNGLNGGLIVNGVTNTNFGYAISGVGDVNGDNYADFIIGASRTNKAYVIFGRSAAFANLGITNLNGANGGFTLIGTGGSGFGSSVSGCGDINGDGMLDMIIGSTSTAYVVFGKRTFNNIEVSNLSNSPSGFYISISDNILSAGTI